MTSPSSTKSVILKFIETLVNLSDDQSLSDSQELHKSSKKPLAPKDRKHLEVQLSIWVQLLGRLKSAVLIMDGEY